MRERTRTMSDLRPHHAESLAAANDGPKTLRAATNRTSLATAAEASTATVISWSFHSPLTSTFHDRTPVGTAPSAALMYADAAFCSGTPDYIAMQSND